MSFHSGMDSRRLSEPYFIPNSWEPARKNTLEEEGASSKDRSKCVTCLVILAAVVSAIAAVFFLGMTVTCVIGAICAGVSGVGAPGIVPAVLLAIMSGALVVGSIACSAYYFKKI